MTVKFHNANKPIKLAHYMKFLRFLASALVLYSGDKRRDAYAIGFRILLVIGMVIFYWNFLDEINVPPKLDQADVTSGILNGEAYWGSRRSSYKIISVETAEGPVELISYDRAKLDSLKEYVGQEVSVWSYGWRGSFYRQKNRIIELEVSGDLLFQNSAQRHKEALDKVSPKAKWFGACLALLSLVVLLIIARKDLTREY